MRLLLPSFLLPKRLLPHQKGWVSLFLIGTVFLFTGCKQPAPADSFLRWVSLQEDLSVSGSISDTQQLVLRSKFLKIDTIFRSMQGPYELRNAYAHAEGLIWLTSYGVQLIDGESTERLPDGYMCHNNLNIVDKASFPWQVKTYGSKVRLFTLTEGQTSVQLPPGFGIPYPAEHAFELVSQVLNHNEPDLRMEVLHEATLQYVRAGPSALTPLYQQAVFVTKQTGGPKGEYNSNPQATFFSDESPELDDIANCQPSVDGSIPNPFMDDYGRTYTGHWTLDTGTQVLHTDVTRQLNLPTSSRIHCIGVHVHPFAVSLELRDRSLDSSLFVASIENHPDRVGIRHIDAFSSAKGIAIHPDHRYELVSTYDCPERNKHSAMATMFLYLADTE